METDTTAWFDATGSKPVRHGWYEVHLKNGESAYAEFGADGWSEAPVVPFTHWRGLATDPIKSGETGTIAAEVSVATGVRAVWDAIFPFGHHSPAGVSAVDK